MTKELKITRRHLPHWSIDDVTYFITFRSKTELNPAECSIVFQHILSGHKIYYELVAFIVMPDHVHLLFHPKENYSLERIMKGIKGVIANKINEVRGTTGQVW